MTLGPGAQVGPYRLERLLGRGGMAVVYEATHATAGRTVALKLVSPDVTDPDFVERFRHEGRMQAALDHPHIVTVYEAGSSQYGPFLAMRLVRGPTLADLIDRGALTSARTLDLLEQVADALDAAHDAGLVHRDVKPRNVLVEDEDRAYLADFGLTRHSDATSATAPGQFMATIAYAAPEVVAGEQAGAAADRYALAAVLFECLTGSSVFPRPTAGAVLFAHASEPPPRVSGRREGIPKALDEVVIAGLAKSPADRPARAAELIQGARHALRGIELGPPAPRKPGSTDDGTTAGQVTMAVPTPPVRRRHARRALALAVAAGAAVGVGGTALVLGSDDPAPAPAVVELPASPAGTQRLGADLAAAAETLGCDGRPVGPASPNCLIFQDRVLSDQALVVPRDGAIRRWGVTSAQGEIALAVLRRDGDAYFQIARSATEFVDSPGPHFWPTDLQVEAGDRIAAVLVEGSGLGVRAAEGATTGRFVPAIIGDGIAEPGIDGELLLQADLLPGARQREPAQITGARAAAAPDGRVLKSRKARYYKGDEAEVKLVMLNGMGRLDLFRDGRRVARMDIPQMTNPIDHFAPIELRVAASKGVFNQLGVALFWTQLSSLRLRFHYVVAYGKRFEFIS